VPQSAQHQAVPRTVQHVIVDNLSETAQHVVIDGYSTALAQGLPVFIQGALPVPVTMSPDLLGRNVMHVVIDDVDTRLSLLGLPVSLKVGSATSAIASAPLTRWRYDVDARGCNTAADLNQRAAQGWELFQAVVLAGPRGGSDIGCLQIYRQPM